MQFILLTSNDLGFTSEAEPCTFTILVLLKIVGKVILLEVISLPFCALCYILKREFAYFCSDFCFFYGVITSFLFCSQNLIFFVELQLSYWCRN